MAETKSETQLVKVFVQCNPSMGFDTRGRGGRVWPKGPSLAEVTPECLAALRADVSGFLVSVLTDAEFEAKREELGIPVPAAEALAKENAELKARLAIADEALQKANALESLLRERGILVDPVPPAPAPKPAKSEKQSEKQPEPKPEKQPK